MSGRGSVPTVKDSSELVLMGLREWTQKYLSGPNSSELSKQWETMYRRFCDTGTDVPAADRSQISAEDMLEYPEKYKGSSYNGDHNTYVLCRGEGPSRRSQLAGELFAFIMIVDAERKRVETDNELPQDFSYIDGVGSVEGTKGMGLEIYNRWLAHRGADKEDAPVLLEVKFKNFDALREKVYPRWGFERCDKFVGREHEGEKEKQVAHLLAEAKKNPKIFEMKAHGKCEMIFEVDAKKLWRYMVAFPGKGKRGTGGKMPKTKTACRICPYEVGQTGKRSVCSMLDECDQLEALMHQLGFDIS